MAPHLSQEIRQHIIAWSQELGKSNTEIAQLAACSEHTVHDVLHLEREFGVVYNPLARPWGCPCILNAGNLTYISSLIAANPVIYLDEVHL